MSTPFIGPAWAQDGTPFLVTDTNRSPGQREKRATLHVVDDYGNAVAYVRRCNRCARWLPLTFGYFHPRSDDRGLGMQAICSVCNAALYRLKYRRDAEYRAKCRAHARETYRKTREDAERWAQVIDRDTRNKAARRAKDPEGFLQRGREANRRYKQRMYADPEKAARHRESQRISYRLREERRQGRDLEDFRHLRVALPKSKLAMVPALTLAVAVEQVIALENREANDMAARESVCARAEIAPRQLSAWRNGEYAEVQFDVADRVVTRLGLVWWEVFGDDEEVAA